MSGMKTFAPKISRSTSIEQTECPACTPVAEDCAPVDEIPFPQTARKLVVNVCVAEHETTGKPWLVQDCLAWDEKAKCWIESCEGIAELPVFYKAGDTLPSFDGALLVHVTGGDPLEVFGRQVLPDNLIGGVLCVNGTVCYTGHAEVPPCPVQIGGDAPELDSGVKLYVRDGELKFAGASGWTQTIPYSNAASGE